MSAEDNFNESFKDNERENQYMIKVSDRYVNVSFEVNLGLNPWLNDSTSEWVIHYFSGER